MAEFDDAVSGSQPVRRSAFNTFCEYAWPWEKRRADAAGVPLSVKVFAVHASTLWADMTDEQRCPFVDRSTPDDLRRGVAEQVCAHSGAAPAVAR